MRFLHSADWHLGRLFHGVSLVEDQAHLLEGFARLVAEARVDAVLIAGDVYDRAVPPPDAVALFDEFLARVAGELGVPTIVIAGNHDSPDRLGFGARLLARGGLHVRGRLEADAAPVVLEDAHGEVEIHALPFVDPPHARAVLADAMPATDGAPDASDASEASPALRDHDAANAAMLERMRAGFVPGRRRVCVAHAFVTGGRLDAESGDAGTPEECESERPLVVGGGGRVDLARFADFDYVALGHLHRPQEMDAGRVRYAGSLMPYSFGEARHGKSVSVVELDPSGAATVEAVALDARRAVRVVEGSFAALLEAMPDGIARDDYLLVRLTDEGALFHPMARLRERHPNVLQIERVALGGPTGGAAATMRRTRRAPEQLFADFFAAVEDRELDADSAVLLREVMRGESGPVEGAGVEEGA